ncbi:basic blue protein [Magnolia sinica]|uniref:basic blue protein n=1 Tax=Magnolia sinica TaxID=86752 RepID=UPI00265949E5|nr:basic blue protein [Magnolia sinica]
MAQGRGSARRSAVGAVAVLLCLLVHCEIAHAAVYNVGDNGGWTFNVVNWPKGKRFRAGDVLVFKYDSTSHNVVSVNSNGYNGCTTPRGAKVYKTGNDRITLAKGQNFFICNFVGHCQGGMKIAVTAA